jgi:predicted dehydrogenase
VQLVAMADVFADRMQGAYRALKGKHADKIDVPRERRFTGLGGYRHVLESDLHLVILATPPGFRPLHFAAAVEAGKHAFLEKPLAVDACGLRRVHQANLQARQKGLAVAVGLQRRHEAPYQETVRRLRDGAIGRFTFARAYWNSSQVRWTPRRPQQTELEYQLRNWSGFGWLGGDHIVEQHIHNLDVVNWALDALPDRANGQGGRSAAAESTAGECFDHHFVEFTYPDGFRLFGQCRRVRDCWNRISEHIHGTDGYADVSGAKIYSATGQLMWHGNGKHDGHQQEQHNLFAALRRGEVPNECDLGAQATMTAILGRMATYSGREVSWDEAIQARGFLADVDRLRALDDPAPVLPDANGRYPKNPPGSGQAPLA